MDKLYGNVGRIIKKMALWEFIFTALAAVGVGIWLICDTEVLWGIVTIVLGPFIAFGLSCFTYVIGDIAENIYETKLILQGSSVKSTSGSSGAGTHKSADEAKRERRIKKLKDLYESGYITKEEYEKELADV